MGNQCTAQDYSPGGGTTYRQRDMHSSSPFCEDSDGGSPLYSHKRQFPWTIPRLSGVSFGGSSTSSFTPNTTESSSYDILKKTASMSALDLQQTQTKNNQAADENEDPASMYFITPTAIADEYNDEPFFLGMRRESFGVGDHYRATSSRFRTKRFRSRLELGMV